MKNNVWTVITLTILTTAITGCSLNSNNQEPDFNLNPASTYELLRLTPAQQEMVNHSNDFAFNLFRQIISSKSSNPSLSSKSIIVSPISITYALGMLNNGAAGNTQQQINNVLGFGDTGADSINNFCCKMLKSAPALDTLTQIMIANTIFMNQGYELKPDFKHKAKTYYNADPMTLNFYDDRTLGIINRWASDNTQQMIDRVLDESTFDPRAVSYLLNAIYFKGSWTFRFDKEKTVEEKFIHAGNSDEVTLRPMMRQKNDFEYAETDDYQALRLPYGNGSFQMTVLLPKAKNEDLNDIPAVPSSEVWNQINQNMSTALVDVKLPGFETDTDIDLMEIMSALGMPDAFNPETADFSKFCDEPTYIDLMKQVAKIKLDEEGTEAAAVTVIGMRKNAVGDTPRPVNFHANHPFIYVISEQNTGAILFIGMYTGY